MLTISTHSPQRSRPERLKQIRRPSAEGLPFAQEAMTRSGEHWEEQMDHIGNNTILGDIQNTHISDLSQTAQFQTPPTQKLPQLPPTNAHKRPQNAHKTPQQKHNRNQDYAGNSTIHHSRFLPNAALVTSAFLFPNLEKYHPEP